MQSVARDLRKRYKRSMLGYLWSMLHPLFMMIILAVVFSNIMRSNIQDYAVFLFCGMLPWTYFDSTAQGALGTIRANAKIMENVSVPKYLFPLSIAWSNMVNFFLSLIPLALVILVLGRSFHFTMLALPIVIIPLFCFTMGIALIFSVCAVFFEDTSHLVTVILRALYYLCPILYSREMLPEWLVPYVLLNPMFSIIELNRSLFYYGQLPDPVTYLIILSSSLVTLTVGLWIFKKSDEKFIYFV